MMKQKKTKSTKGVSSSPDHRKRVGFRKVQISMGTQGHKGKQREWKRIRQKQMKAHEVQDQRTKGEGKKCLWWKFLNAGDKEILQNKL